jgi:hypothetical protein
MRTSDVRLPELDVTSVPFSRRRSNWAVSYGRAAPCRTDRLYLRYIFGGESTDLYRIELDDDIDYAVEADPSILRMFSPGGGRVEIAMDDKRAARIRGTEVRLTLRLSESISQGGGWQWEQVIPEGRRAGGAQVRAWRAIIRKVKHHVAVISGDAVVHAPWHPRSEGARRHHYCSPIVLEFGPESFEVVLEDYSSEWEPRRYDDSFLDVVDASSSDFTRWHDAAPETADEYADASWLASYVTWSAIVPPAGNFTHPTMLMSKRWMNKAWNWDNYFNAWATAYRDPAYALAQYHLHIDHQHPQGALGDGIDENSVGFTYTKPPVHGWILKRMLEIHPYSDDELEPLYEPLCRWTEWWFRYRDDDRDGVCQYHHGNDSGWDDASAFDVTPPVECPDLSALLVIQMEVLAELAERLGKSSDTEQWRARSRATLETLIEHSWRDGRFVAMQSGTHTTADSGGDSLLCQIPIVLGHRLPGPQRHAIAAALSDEGRFLCEHGLATESARSPHFLPQGYWRGPMWAPAVMMIVDGLMDAGEIDLGREIARRFCDACRTNGFAECYNPLTGASIHDPAYTWAASVFVVLAQLI